MTDSSEEKNIYEGRTENEGVSDQFKRVLRNKPVILKEAWKQSAGTGIFRPIVALFCAAYAELMYLPYELKSHKRALKQSLENERQNRL